MNAREKAAELGLKEIRAYMGLFDYTVVIVVGDYAKMPQYLAVEYEEKPADFELINFDADKGFVPRGRCFYKPGYVPVIWIPRKPRGGREHATLAHECIHAVFHLFDWAAVPITRDTEEVMAHAVAHIITEVGEAYKK